MKQQIIPLQSEIVDCSTPDFAERVVQHLAEGKITALANLPDELNSAINALFTSGDDFFDSLANINTDDYPQKFVPNGVCGLYGPKKGKNLCCNNGVRFFMTTDQAGQFSGQKIPTMKGENIMERATNSFNIHSESLLRKIFSAMEKKFSFEEDALSQAMGTTNVALTRYYPITQARQLQLHNEDLLFFDDQEPSKMILFDEHIDMNVLTMLCYRGGARGLEFLIPGQGEQKHYSPVEIPNDNKYYFIIVTGTILTKLTNGEIKSYSHRVATTPEAQKVQTQLPPHEWRFTLAYHRWFGQELIAPLKRKNTDTGSFDPPVNHDQYFSENLSYVQKNAAVHRREDFPLEIARQYPMDIKYPEIYVSQLGEDSIGDVEILLSQRKTCTM